jgi:hypothetical protein
MTLSHTIKAMNKMSLWEKEHGNLWILLLRKDIINMSQNMICLAGNGINMTETNLEGGTIIKILIIIL